MKLLNIETALTEISMYPTLEESKAYFIKELKFDSETFDANVERFRQFFPEGFYMICSEAEHVAEGWVEALRIEAAETWYAPIRAFEEALEMQKVEGYEVFYDPFNYVVQTVMTSPKLKHPVLYSCEGGITAQIIHKDDLEAVLELARNV